MESFQELRIVLTEEKYRSFVESYCNHLENRLKTGKPFDLVWNQEGLNALTKAALAARITALRIHALAHSGPIELTFASLQELVRFQTLDAKQHHE